MKAAYEKPAIFSHEFSVKVFTAGDCQDEKPSGDPMYEGGPFDCCAGCQQFIDKSVT